MTADTTGTIPQLTSTGRMLVLVCAFLGWMCAGFHLATTQQIGRQAAQNLLDNVGALSLEEFDRLSEASSAGQLSEAESEQLKSWNGLIAKWYAWYQCAFLFGAATGGFAFGRLGDRIGRAKAMSASILMYSGMAGIAYYSATPSQLLIAWFLACTGVGGMWPNGVALLSEAWSGLSRTVVSGLIGTAANVGLFILTTVATKKEIVPDDWRWVLLFDAAPFALGIFSLFAVPESPRWLAARAAPGDATTSRSSNAEIFRPPLLRITLIGILLGTIPMIGGWGSANWMIPWADQAVEASENPDPKFKAQVGQARAFTGMIGSLIGGWVASWIGRRRTYFWISVFCLAIAQWTFWEVYPTDRSFLFWVAALGFFSGLYFGWLPLCLPELFPTRVRSTGAGVSFNFGRIITAITVFGSGLLFAYFKGRYEEIGRVTSLIFALGIVATALMPDTSERSMEE